MSRFEVQGVTVDGHPVEFEHHEDWFTGLVVADKTFRVGRPVLFEDIHLDMLMDGDSGWWEALMESLASEWGDVEHSVMVKMMGQNPDVFPTPFRVIKAMSEGTLFEDGCRGYWNAAGFYASCFAVAGHQSYWMVWNGGEAKIVTVDAGGVSAGVWCADGWSGYRPDAGVNLVVEPETVPLLVSSLAGQATFTPEVRVLEGFYDPVEFQGLLFSLIAGSAPPVPQPRTQYPG